MRTKGLMGVAVDKLTKSEKDDMFALLDRMSRGVSNQRTQTPLAEIAPVEEVVPTGENVVAFSGASADRATARNIPHKAFPPEFYEYFEFAESEAKFG